MPIQRITSGILANGAIVAADIADGIVTNAKLAGSITSDKITSVSNTAIAGLIQAAQIGSVSNTALSGVIEVAQLADTLNLASKTVTLPAGVGGKVLQVVQTVKTDTFTTTSTSFTDVTGLSVSITPTSAASKILVFYKMSCGNSGTASTRLRMRLMRDATAIYIADAAGSRIQASSFGANADKASFVNDYSGNFLDSPATTSSTTYSIQLSTQANTATVNREGSPDTDSSTTARGVSSILVMEIAA